MHKLNNVKMSESSERVFAVFAAIIGVTMYVTYLAAKRVKSASDFYTAGGGVSGLAAARRLARAGVEAAAVDHVVFGNALQTSADAIYLARHVALRAGLPIQTPAVTVNRLCGSGFESIIQGAQQILLGESKIAYHRGLEQADGVARRRVTKARFELFGHRCAADQVPTLEYTDPQAGTC